MHKHAAIAILLITATPSIAQDNVTIEQLNRQFIAAFAKGDFGAMASMYTEDAYLLPPGTQLIRGRSGIQAFWTKAAEGIADLELTIVDVKALGSEAAREVGTFKVKTKGQQPQEGVGKYVVVWQKVGNDWKLAVDIWNADKNP
jgi:uncharacterized protein (TIGR02246 family)